MNEDTLKWLVPLIISVFISIITIIGNAWIQKYKTKGDSESTKITTKVTAEDSFRDDLIQQNKDLLNLEKFYRDELRQFEMRYRENTEKLESKYDIVLQTMRTVQIENAELKLINKQLSVENKQLLARISELENHVARLEQQQREQKNG